MVPRSAVGASTGSWPQVSCSEAGSTASFGGTSRSEGGGDWQLVAKEALVPRNESGWGELRAIAAQKTQTGIRDSIQFNFMLVRSGNQR